MKIKCPACGARGTDVEPVPEEMRGPSWKPSKGEEDYAFEVRGHQGTTLVRKCLNCGGGVYVKPFSRRCQAIPPEQWKRMEAFFAEQSAAMAAHRERVFEEFRQADESPPD